MRNENELKIGQRTVAAIIYITVLITMCRIFNGDWSFIRDTNTHFNILFVSGALMLILGTYIVEPFFTKPVDVIANTIAIILSLLSINEPAGFIGYDFLFYFAVTLLSVSVFQVLISHVSRFEKFQKILYEIVTKLGRAEYIFSAVYLLATFSYFRTDITQFISLFGFWIILFARSPVDNIAIWISKVLGFAFGNKKYSEAIGEAIGCENPFLYKVEINFFKHRAREVRKGELVYLELDKKEGAVGLIVNEKQLLNKKWVTIYLFRDDFSPLKINFKSNTFIADSNNIFSKSNLVFSFDLASLEEDEQRKITDNSLYKNRHNFIGYVAEGSNINQIHFHALADPRSDNYSKIREGTIVKCSIHSNETLFQIIDGQTNEEKLEKHDIYGFLTGIAQKLGYYDEQKRELRTVKWLPDIYSPVFLFSTPSSETISDDAIGKLPETPHEIVIREPNELVTHNTAILGILGIGKSCLTFELIQKVVSKTSAKIFCVDITNQYQKELPHYFNTSLIQEDLTAADKTALKQSSLKTGSSGNPKEWGNEEDYKTKLDAAIKAFSESGKRVITLNPDWHAVMKATSKFNIEHAEDLTVAEKTRIIAERLFLYARSQGETDEAKYLLVFEEAHSLIPEWNSVSNDGDKSASNGTAKVILQGRKYGLGSFVVTQRTANISKSILNQCNTIFALRVFDDTGKQFLENYIGSDYANVLPTLEERHSIAVGKALLLKQPVIIRLHDKASIIVQNNAEDTPQQNQ